MTAEIAILNKTAVALAADSAVTISAGSKEEKTYDSADKLFELSDHDAIGIMVYNDMGFAETPLPALIRRFRSEGGRFHKVEEAARSFLAYLNDYGSKSPQPVKNRSIVNIVAPLFVSLDERYSANLKEFSQNVQNTADGLSAEDITKVLASLLDEALEHYEGQVGALSDALFVGDGPVCFDPGIDELLTSGVDAHLAYASPEQKRRAVEIAKSLLKSEYRSNSSTGIVVAGFGSGEIFPTLVSFEIDGIVCGRLRYVQTNVVDIDREGARAKVLPFARKEMVERFLYGLDENIQRDIAKFCDNNIRVIREQISSQIEFPDDGNKQAFEQNVGVAEALFLQGLRQKAFDAIRSKSQAEIESMVEFMPKPELAKMAEALVNLTSMKRRVSKGMETVGGPIDVAIISQSEGFVWVKRKHYFEPDLNARYLNRVNYQMNGNREAGNGQDASRGSNSKRGRASPDKAARGRRLRRAKGSDQADTGRDQEGF